MCDYSLEHVASRPAKIGDKLVTTRFGHSFTGGFCAIGEPNVAVCLRPGTELAFDREIRGVAAFQLSLCHCKHNLPDQPHQRPSLDRNRIA